eukprot:CAMPEP_0113954336 /NCGR_PEP_ID=MMETSP0011_2-20120614/466_1 /TAXON_ID=101924 /ORGANISM="Rhodosorus marinus" /LENGTH=80 /DNA_ID=CAMNT_0000963393 /DNA_START=122 /DNA_END=364 /DNA_ORIENTATION=+ /assembly_acc=CAM_ASM_000156
MRRVVIDLEKNVQRNMRFTMKKSRLLETQVKGGEGYLWMGWSGSGQVPRSRIVMPKEVFRSVEFGGSIKPMNPAESIPAL